MARLIFVVLALLTIVGCGPASGDGERARRNRPLLVSGAISLSGVLDTLAAAYERDTGIPVELNLEASSALAAQIIAGAPVDLFISADLFQMDRVAEEGLIRSETRVDLLSNQLVIVVPADMAAPLTSPAMLLEPVFGRVAVGEPAGVPVGVYARVYLEAIGLWDRLGDRIVPARSARAVLATVETGAVDAGIVYRTDAMTSSGVTVVFEVPVAEGPVIAYPAAVTTEGRHPTDARQLLAYLQGTDARAVFEAAGFIVPGS